ncbi:MAG: hypothetical protein U0Z26_18645 [Anaerolineales bacterium]
MAKLNGWFKIGLVLGGYVMACLLANAAVYVNDLYMDPVTAAGGMAAFGDMILFIGVCGVAALVPTGLGLYFLWVTWQGKHRK